MSVGIGPVCMNVNKMRYLAHEKIIYAPHNSCELKCIKCKHVGFQITDWYGPLQSRKELKN